ncbi:hypothetical protein CR513_33180, partial [Mucuna pruriens]
MAKYRGVESLECVRYLVSPLWQLATTQTLVLHPLDRPNAILKHQLVFDAGRDSDGCESALQELKSAHGLDSSVRDGVGYWSQSRLLESKSAHALDLTPRDGVGMQRQNRLHLARMLSILVGMTLISVALLKGVYKGFIARDKKGAENTVADHLSQLEREVDPLPIRDEFPDEQI